MNASRSLEGKVVLVTGAGRGIGATTAQLLADRGAVVVATDSDERAAAALAAAIGSAGGRAHSRRLDVTDEDAWRDVMAWTLGSLDGLDGLVNNAGISVISPLAMMRLEDFRTVFEVNVVGTFLGLKHAFLAMLERSSGRPAHGSIVNVSSVVGIKATANGSAYAGSKAAVRHLSKCAALEWAREGHQIRVNSVHPAITATDMLTGELSEWAAHGTFGTHDVEETRTIVARLQPLGRFVEPLEVARTIAFLLSDEASFTTGAEIPIDGGQLTS
ncbi:MAG: SDR family NAD(P)-dependent oxidoreductase [Acidimicrobiales bacterium]